MDFDEMKAACNRALSTFTEKTIDGIINTVPELEDLKQRLQDKHAVSYDPICIEAVNYLTLLEARLRSNELLLAHLIGVIATAVDSLRELVKGHE